MPLTPKPGTQRRESILLMGPPGSGKSWAWRSIAEWMDKTGTPGRIVGADTDRAWEGQRPDDGHLDNQVAMVRTPDFESVRDAVEAAVKDYQPGDWLVVDMIGRLWDFAQEFYTEQVFGQSMEDFWLDAKKYDRNVGGAHGTNWAIIKKLYYAVLRDVFDRWPGHLLCCTPVADIREPDKEGKGGDSTLTRSLFGKFGVKPAGRDDLPHPFHTVLLLQEVPKKGHVLTSVKDRNRDLLTGEPIPLDFVATYLLGVAGWEMTAEPETPK